MNSPAHFSKNAQSLKKALTEAANDQGFITLPKTKLIDLLIKLGSRYNLIKPKTFIGNNEPCCICTEDEGQPVTLLCGHTACKPCLLRWYCTKSGNHTKCPYCREPLGKPVIKKLKKSRYFKKIFTEGKEAKEQARLEQEAEDHRLALEQQEADDLALAQSIVTEEESDVTEEESESGHSESESE